MRSESGAPRFPSRRIHVDIHMDIPDTKDVHMDILGVRHIHMGSSTWEAGGSSLGPHQR